MRLILALLLLPAAVHAQPRDRATFHRTLAQVREGMTQDQVRAITGAPDDVLARTDPELEPTTIVSELWGFGCDRHGDFPSLGSVAFDRQGRVFLVRGGTGTPITRVPEPELRRLMALLAAVPGLDGDDFDPRPLIRAVNALQPLGAQRALDVIEEHLRVAPAYAHGDTQGFFLVLRALFEPTPSHPPMLVGAPEPTLPEQSRLSLYPLAVLDGVPFLLVSGYMLGGQPQPPEQHLQFYRTQGRLRAGPLAPGARPFTALTSLMAQVPSQRGEHAWQVLTMEQVLRLVADVYRPAPIAVDAHFDPSVDPSARFAELAAAFDRLGARWDPARGAYGAPGAAPPSALARASRPRFFRAHRGIDFEILFERRSQATVRAWIHLERRATGPVSTQGSVQIVDSDGRALRDHPIASALDAYAVVDVPLAAGRSLTVRAQHAGERFESPALTP
ncbi:MAG: hypothetical protein IT378_10910 [Sandaracinaceae bacterium]|nr:hypothetical protein [Sandaracinaceae bacterium]